MFSPILPKNKDNQKVKGFERQDVLKQHLFMGNKLHYLLFFNRTLTVY